MRILVTNDDGIDAEGISALAKELEKEHEVIVAAPSEQRSASGHSITIQRPLLVKEVKIPGVKSKAYSVSGTPADCVRVALDKLTDGKVDMVVSGINYGVNLGTDVLYSGTVSAAIEAALYNLPSIAVSQHIGSEYYDFNVAAKYAAKIVKIAHKNDLEGKTVLNVNIPGVPEDEIKGIKTTKVGAKSYTNHYVPLRQEDGGVIYELRDELIDIHHEDNDTFYLNDGYVTISPLQYDLTNFNLINEVTKWF
ncbi:5'/3'-nucleotidase SurE [Clostridium polynesiense]|uniref:5'/3'-nucleotidase SurE n=1 Tax=Clostridium polynesiense TaxID=1325933 RepID=UPI00058E71DC|nr:5'/3'-nucleotidase SurE [Clostridium polynesiense]